MENFFENVCSLYETLAPVNPMAITDAIGSTLKYMWPKIKGVFSSISTEEVRRAINANEEWFVSEKLDGCNVSVSTAGWVGSRNQIVAHLIQEKNFEGRKIQNISVKELKPLFNKIWKLAKDLNKECGLNLDVTQKDQLILYGEFILPGTANSKHDIYDNKRNGFKIGQLYVFGIGFVFDNLPINKISQHHDMLKKHFSNVMVIEPENFDDKSTFFICPINQKNKKWLIDCAIDLVPFYKTEKFVDLLTRRNKANLIEKLESRKMEGFVLHDATNQMFKWKYQYEPNNYCDGFIEGLKKEWNANENEIKVVSALFDLYNYSREFVTSLDLEAFNVAMNEFYLLNGKNFEEQFLTSQPNQDFSLSFFIECWKNHAEAKILYQLLPKSKVAYDKNIKMEYTSLIIKFFQRQVKQLNLKKYLKS